MADNTVDTLQVKISSDANKAVQAISNLQNKLTGLNTALGGLNTGGLSSLASGVSQLTHAMSSFKSGAIKTADFTRISNGLNKLGTVNVQGVSDASRAINTLTANLSQIGMIKFNSAGLDNITASISRLGRASVTEATQNLEFLKSSVSQFVAGMNSIGSVTFGTENLYKLVSSVSRLGSKNATQSVKNLPQISTYLKEFVTSMNAIGSVSFDFKGLNNLVANISRLGGSKATQSVQNLKPIKDQLLRFISGLNGIGALKFDLTGLNGLVSAISRLGGKASTNAVPNIQALGIALKQLMATLATAPLVSQNLINMTNALANLASSGSKVTAASKGMQSSLNGYSLSAKNAKNHTTSLAAAFGKFYATYWLLLRGFKQLGKAIDLSSALTEVQNVVDVTFGEYASLVENFSNTSIQDFGISELTAKQVSSRFQAMGTAMGFSRGRMADMSIELTKLAADMASFYNVEQKVVAEDLEAIFTGQTRPLRTYGLDLTQATLREWALKQGLDANVQSMSQAEKTLLRYQYVLANTGAAQGDFAKTSGTWANQLRILNENFKALGSIVGGVLINAFKPFITALNQVMSAVMQFAKVISDALGAIFGWEFQVGGGGGLADAAGDIEDLSNGAGGAADNLGSAADNAEKLKENLQGFDELNVISASDSSSGGGSGGGGGGGGGGATPPEDVGQWVPTESLWEKYTSSIDSLFKLGEYIGKTLTDAMNSIDWDSVYESARNFGAGLASFLNGLISPELFGATGRTIAGALNTALYAALSFGQTFDWTDFGLSIATGINEFFKTFDFAALGQGITTFYLGLLNTINTALQNIDWYNIGKQIGTFLANLDWEKIMSEAGKAIVLGIGAAIQIYVGSLEVAPLETAIITGIVGFKYRGIGKSISNGITTALSGGIMLKNISIFFEGISPQFNSASFVILGNEIITKIDDFIKEHFGEHVVNALGEGLLIATGAGVGAVLGGPIGALIGGAIGVALDTFSIKGEQITKFWNKIGSDLFNWNVAGSLLDNAKKSFEKAFSAENFAEFGVNIVEGIINGMAAAVTWVIEPIMDLFDIIVEGICDLFGINSPAKKMEPYGGYILQGIIEGFRNTFEEWTKALNEWFTTYISPWFTAQKWSDLYNTIKTSLKAKWDETVGQWATDIQSWWENNVSPWFTMEKWLGIAAGMKDGIKKGWDNTVGQWITDIQSWWNTNVAVWFTVEKWEGVASGIKGGLSNAFNAAVEAVKGIWNSFARWLNGKLSFEMPAIKNPLNGETIFGGDTIQLGKLPILEKGGVLRKGQYGFLEGNGAEAVVPLEKNTKWIKEVASMFNYQMANNAPKYEIKYNIPDVEIPNNKTSKLDLIGSDDGSVMELLADIREQNELLREQSELLRGIYDKPVIDKNDVGTLYKSYAKDFRSQTGKQLGISF